MMAVHWKTCVQGIKKGVFSSAKFDSLPEFLLARVLEKDADVIAKEKQAVKYCEDVSDWSYKSHKKEWRYVFIPSTKVQINSSFNTLAKRFMVTKN